MIVTVADQVFDLLRARNFCLNGGGVTGDVELLVFSGYLDLAIATNRVANFLRDARGERELGVLLQGPEDFVRGVTRCTGIPQTESSDAVGVHVLRRSLEFSKHGERMARAIGEWVVHLEKNSPVALNDEGTVGIHNQPVYVWLLSPRRLSTHAGW